MIKHLWRNLKVNVACKMKREASGRAELRKIGSFGMGFAPLAAAHDRRNFGQWIMPKNGIATVKANVWAFVDGHLETHRWT